MGESCSSNKEDDEYKNEVNIFITRTKILRHLSSLTTLY